MLFSSVAEIWPIARPVSTDCTALAPASAHDAAVLLPLASHCSRCFWPTAVSICLRKATRGLRHLTRNPRALALCPHSKIAYCTVNGPLALTSFLTLGANEGLHSPSSLPSCF